MGHTKKEPEPSEILNDSLGEMTRKERRNLLAASTFGFLVSFGGLIPTKFTALGIELSAPEQNVFVWLVLLTIGYFFCAFLFYGFADLLVWRKKYQDYLMQCEVEYINADRDDENLYEHYFGHLPKIYWVYEWTGRVAWARVLFDYLVPIAFAVFVIGGLAFDLYL